CDQKESAISAISALLIGLGVLFLAIACGNSRYATNILFGSIIGVDRDGVIQLVVLSLFVLAIIFLILRQLNYDSFDHVGAVSHHRSEEHTSELQSRFDLVCRLLLEKKKHINIINLLSN